MQKEVPQKHEGFDSSKKPTNSGEEVPHLDTVLEMHVEFVWKKRWSLWWFRVICLMTIFCACGYPRNFRQNDMLLYLEWDNRIFSEVGSVMNFALPSWLILILLIVILVHSAFKTFKKADWRWCHLGRCFKACLFPSWFEDPARAFVWGELTYTTVTWHQILWGDVR